MKTLLKVIVLTFVLLAVLTSSEQVSTVKSETATLGNIAIAYIRNVLPFNLANYTITADTPSPVGNSSFSLLCQLSLGSIKADVHFNFFNERIALLQFLPRQGAVESDQSYANFVEIARTILLRHQAQTGLDSTEMISTMDMVNYVGPGSQNSTLGNYSLEIKHFVPIPTNPGPGIVSELIWTYQDRPLFLMFFEGDLLFHFYDYRAGSNTSNASTSISEEQAKNIATDYIKNYSYIFLNGSKVSGFGVSNTTASLLLSLRTLDLTPCWTVTFTLNQTYPGSVTQLFVNLWADTGEIFASGAFSPTRQLTINNQYPTPSPTPTSPTPSPSASPAPLASPSSPSTSPTHILSPFPTLTLSPSRSPTQQPTLEPTQTANPTLEPSNDGDYFPLIGLVVIVIVVAVAGSLVYFKKHKRS
jgi:hypothetical protein